MVVATKEHLKDGIARLGWTVGEHSYGSPFVGCPRQGGKLSIGKYCSIARGVSILLGGEHRTDWVTTYPFSTFRQEWPTGERIVGHPTSKGDIVIGHDVWIGQRATIMSGVRIGHGGVIASSAVVFSDVPAYGIALGNPARTYKKRFSEDVIARLLKLAWWDWPDEKVREAIPLMCSTDIESFLKAYEVRA